MLIIGGNKVVLHFVEANTQLDEPMRSSYLSFISVRNSSSILVVAAKEAPNNAFDLAAQQQIGGKNKKLCLFLCSYETINDHTNLS